MATYESLGIQVPPRRTTGDVNVECPQCKNLYNNKHKPLSVNLEKECGNCKRCGWKFTLKEGRNFYVEPKKTYRKPHPLPFGESPNEVTAYLEARGITKDIQDEYRITGAKTKFPSRADPEEAVQAILFPYYKNGEHVNTKYRSFDKDFKMAYEAESVLYGHDNIPMEPNSELIWVEGEVDALSLSVAGFKNCVSVPNGAMEKDFSCLRVAEKKLSAIKKHILAVDNDTPGKGLEQELERRLGPEKCWRVTWPEGCKDANDVLTKLGVAVLRDCLSEAKPAPVEGIIEISDLYTDIEYLYHHGLPPGMSTGLSNLDQYYRPREGELCVITGIPSHGKTAVITYIMHQLINLHNWHIGICSPEHQPLSDYTTDFMKLLIGKPFDKGRQDRMMLEEARMSMQWLDKCISFILPSTKERTIDKILELAQVQIFRHSMKGLVIDPWSKLNHTRPAGQSLTEHVSECLSLLTDFAKQHKICIWLVAHPTKLQRDIKTGNYPVPSAYDISDSSHFYNGPDVVLSIWRNVLLRSNRVEVHIQKIKFAKTGKIGKIYLKWNPFTGAFTPDGTEDDDIEGFSSDTTPREIPMESKDEELPF